MDPVTGTVVKNITTDHTGSELVNAQGKPRLWYDVVYMEDAEQGQHYLFANEGDVYTENGVPHSFVTVIDTVAQKASQR